MKIDVNAQVFGNFYSYMMEKRRKEGIMREEGGQEDTNQFVTYMERYQFKSLGSIIN